MQYDTVLERGDLRGATVWKRVLAAIDMLLATDRAGVGYAVAEAAS